MKAYIIRRILLLIPTFLLLTILVFLSVRFIPGDVIDRMMVDMEAHMAHNVDRAALERKLGLDQPVYVQYGRWMGGILLRGTLGNSLFGDWSVEEKILGRLPVTIELGIMAIVIGIVIALPVGIYSAIRRNTAADYVGRSVAIVGLATPNFWLGDDGDDLSGNLVVLVATDGAGTTVRKICSAMSACSSFPVSSWGPIWPRPRCG